MKEIIKRTEDKVIDATEKWAIKNPCVRALTQLLPITAAIDAGLATRVENFRRERTRAFFEELDKDGSVLTDELVQTDDFLHAFYATTKAALNTKRKEKIEMFARLLKSFADTKNNVDIDEYEDILNILDELSFRELFVLSILEKHEEGNPQAEGINQLQKTNVFWKDFVNEVSSTLDISEDELTALLTRLNRTGCYYEITGGYFDYSGGQGYLTPLYFKLKALISE